MKKSQSDMKSNKDRATDAAITDLLREIAHSLSDQVQTEAPEAGAHPPPADWAETGP